MVDVRVEQARGWEGRRITVPSSRQVEQGRHHRVGPIIDEGHSRQTFPQGGVHSIALCRIDQVAL